jgi:hypothetical protein
MRTVEERPIAQEELVDLRRALEVRYKLGLEGGVLTRRETAIFLALLDFYEDRR